MSEVRVWLNGRIVDSEGARLHHLTHSFHYGLGAFEGVRAYEVGAGCGAVFRLREHMTRLMNSCHLVTLDKGLQWSGDQLGAACVEALRANHLASGYLRPVVYLAHGAMGVGAAGNPVHAMIAAWKWGAYLGEDGLQHGIRACISSFQRPGHATTLTKGKVTGQYVNSILAKREALMNGYDEAILLNEQGYITEASGENLFMVQDGLLVTPPLGMNILGGITRATIIEVASDLGFTVVERPFARDELYCADEVFLTGTAAEVTPVREVDGRKIGSGTRGAITAELQAVYFDIVYGRNPKYERWLTRYELAASQGAGVVAVG
ncbi:MAG: branched-chain amino acid transaminase [Myxococcales bacterium]|nr:branched-chain amino acid transaminase [Myxococcales bacterium]